MTAIAAAPQARPRSAFAEVSRQSLPARTPVASAVALALLSIGASGAAKAQALPTNGQFVAGSGTITTPNSTTVQVNQFTQRGATEWQTFNVAPGYSFRAELPNASSVHLARAVGVTTSTIGGSVWSNGQLFLVNPNGVVFTKGASVDVGGLVASTLNITNNNFMAGNYVFTAGSGSGSIVNEANITVPKGGYVAFLGKQVHNTGTIVASNGSVAFGAGDSMLLDFDGDGLLNLKVNAAAADAAITHGGVIQADGGRVVMSAQAKNALLRTVLNVDGMVTARSLVERQGEIFLDGGRSGVTAIAGTLDASNVTGGKGGEIRVLGEYVGLFGNAKLDASGATGGGSILVGGDYQGKNADIANAAAAFVSPDAQIRADALASGDAGRIIVWSDGSTKAYGTFSARGGTSSGNGGFVETSGHFIDVAGARVDTSAPNGAFGMWLIDPFSVTLVHTPLTSQNGAFDVGGAWTPSATGSQVADGTINTQLLLTDVTITTTNAGGAEAGNITVRGTVDAGGAVVINNGAVATTRTLALVADPTTGAIDVHAGAQLGTSVGNTSPLNVTLTAGTTVTMAGTITTTNTAGTNGGNVTINAPGGATIGGNIEAGGTVAGGTVTFNVGAASTASGVISGTNAAVTKAGAGTLTVSGNNSYTGATNINAGTLIAANNTALGTTAAGTTVASGATLALQGDVTIGNEALSITGTGDGGNGALRNISGINAYGGTVTLAGASTIQSDAGTLTLNNANAVTGAAQNLTLQGVAGTANTISGTITTTTGTLTKAGAGTWILSGANTYDGLTSVNGGNLIVSNATGLGSTVGATTVADGASLTVSGNITVADDLTLNGAGLGGGGALIGTGGTPTVSGAITLGTGTPTIAVSSGNTLTASGVVSGTSLTKVDAGTLVLGNAGNTYAGATSILNGVLSISADANLGTAPGAATPGHLFFNGGTLEATASFTLNANRGITTLSAGATIQVDPTFTLDYNGAIAGNSSLTKTGAGILNLGGSNTYVGGTNINAGTLSVSGGAAIPDTSAVTIANVAGATLDLANSETIGSLAGGGSTGGAVALNANTLTTGDATNTAFAGVISGTGTLVKQGAGTFALSGTNAYTGATNINGGVLSISADANLGTAPGAATPNQLTFNNGTLQTTATFALNTNRGVAFNAGGGTIETATGTTLTYGGIADGAGAFAKTGTGNLLLAGANTYTGATAVNAGTLRISNAGGLGATGSGSETTVASGAALSVEGGITTAEALTLNGSGVGGAGALTGSGTSTVSGAITLGTGTPTVGVVAGPDTLTLSGAVGGTSLTKVGTGTLELTNAANNYSGATNVNAGALSASNGTAIPDTSAVIVAAGAGLTLLSNETIGSLAGDTLATGGIVQLNANTLTTGGNDTTTTFAGQIAGAGGLTKAGAGTFTLSGNNVYAGATQINSGTLVAASPTALGSNAAGTTVANGANLTISNTTISNNEAVTLNGGTALTGTGTSSLNGSVTLNANSTLTTATAGVDTLTISGAIGDGGSIFGITKAGSGTLVLTNTNTYDGATTIAGGTLAVTSSDSLGSGFVGNNTLIFNGSGTEILRADGTINSPGTRGVTLTTSGTFNTNGNNVTIVGVVSGPGTSALVKAGAGTLTLSNINTYAGLTNINAGTLVANSSRALGDESATNTLFLSGGTLQAAAAIDSPATRGVTLSGAGTIDTNANTVTIRGVIADAASGSALNKNGLESLVLTAANTYDGPTLINAGALRATSSGALGTSAGGVTVANNAVLELQGNITIADALNINGNGLGNGAIRNIQDNNFLTGTVTLAGASNIQSDTGTLTMSVTNAIAVTGGGQNLTLQGAGNGTIIGRITTGAGTLTKNDAGTWTLSGVSDYTGATAINAGTLVVTPSSGALGTSAGGVTVASGATLALQGGGISISDSISIAGTGVGGNGALRNLAGANSIDGTVTLTGASTIQSDAGTITINNGSNTITGSNQNLTVQGAGDSQIFGVIGTGSGTLTKDGTGVLTLTGANTYTGTTNIIGGTLRAFNNTALGTTAGGTTVASGATLALGGITVGNEALSIAGNGVGGNGALRNLSSNTTFGGTVTLTGPATIQSDAGTLTLNNASAITGAGQNVTFQGPGDVLVSGAITTGAGTLTKAGTGTLTLSGTNTYSGTTAINQGTLIATNASALGSTTGGTVVLNGANLTIANVAIAGEAVTLNGGSALTGTGTASLSGNVTLGADSTITVNGTDALALSGAIGDGAGTFGVTKGGAGTLTLSGVNTYDGATQISAGTLIAANASALGSTTGSTTVLNGANLTIANVAIGGEAVTLNGGTALTGTGTASLSGPITLSNADSTITTAASLDLSGVVGGSFGIVKAGSGTLTLTRQNTYTGTTSIDEGMLVLLGAATLGSSTNGTTVANGATLAFLTSTVSADDFELVTIAGSGVGGNGALRNLGGTNLFPGLVTLNGAATIQSDAGSLVLNRIGNAITGVNQNLTLQGSGNGAISGTITTAAGTLTKNGTGTWTLSAANTYTGTTTINGGTLIAANVSALGAADGTAATGTTVAAGANLTIAGVAIGNEAVTLNGGNSLTATGAASLSGPITLATADSTITVGGADTLGLSGAIGDGVGTFGITKAGTGTLTLSGANTYDGTTVINAGTLIASNASALGSTTGGTTAANGANLTIAGVAIGTEALTLNGGIALTGTGTASLSGPVTLATADSTITVGGSNALTLSGAIGDGAGTFGIIKAGTGTLTLSGSNTYDGVTSINAGTLVAANGSALGTTTGGTTVANGANLTISNVTIGNEAVTLNGGTALTGVGTAAAPAVLAGPVTLNADTLISVGGGGTGSFEITGAIGDGAGTFGINKTGSGVLSLSGTNTYDGLTTISDGTLRAQSTSALGSTANGTIVANGANLTVCGVGCGTGTNLTIIGESLTLNGGNALTGIGTLVVWSGPITLASADSTIGSSAGTTFQLSGVISDGPATLGIVKDRSGTLMLTGANTYGGSTTIAQGILGANSSSALGDGTSTNALVLMPTGFGTLRADGAITSPATRPMQLIGVSSIDTNGNTVSIAGVVSGNAVSSLTKDGTGALVLSGNNTFDGALTVNGGVLVAASNNALGSTTGGTTINGPATLRIANSTIGAEPVTLNNGGLLVGTGTTSLAGPVSILTSNTTITADGTDALTLSGAISDGTGAFGFTKTGTGTLVLSGNNTYDGGTTLAAGTLRAQGSATALGLGTLTLNDATTLQLAGDTGLNFGNNTTIAGNVAIESDRVTAGAGVTHTLGTLSIGSNTLTVNRNATVTSGTAGVTFGATTLTGNPTFAPATGTLLTLGAVSGAGRNLTVNGAGNITFAGAVGDTANRLGAIAITNANNVTASGPITAASLVQSAGTGTAQLDGAVNTNAVAGVSLTGNTQIVNNTITTTGGGGVTFANAGTLTINGNVVSDNAVAQTGAGGVTINSRTVTTTGDAVSFAAPVTLVGTATTSIDTTVGSAAGNTITFNNTIGGSGAQSLTLNSGTSALMFNGAISGLSSLTLTNSAATNFNAGVTIGGALTQTNAATGATTFTGPVSAASATLRGTTFDVNNSFATMAGALNVTNSGTFTKGATGDINAAGGLSISGNASLRNNIITANSPFSVGGTTALTGATRVSTGTGTVDFTGAVSGNNALAIESGGQTIFGAPVSIGSLVTDAGGTTVLIGNSMTTAGAQTYNDPVTVATSTTFASTGNAAITFNNTLDRGVISLTGTPLEVNVNTGGTTTFAGAVGAARPFDSLTTNVGGTTDINGGSVTTAGAQTYNDAVTLTANTTLTSNTAGISFANNVNSDTTPRTLTLNTPATAAGTVTFSGNVGNTAALSDLDVNAGSVLFNGAAAQTVNVTAPGGDARTFSAPVTLAQNLTINSGGNDVTFTNTVNADTQAAVRTLTVNTGAGRSTFNAGLGTTNELGAVTLAGANANITGNVLVNGGGNVDLTGVTNLSFTDGAKIDTDRTGGATAAGSVLMAASTNAIAPTTQSALVTWTIDATADGGAASGNVRLGNVGTNTNVPRAFNVFGENVDVIGRVQGTQIGITANTVTTTGTGILVASRPFENDVAQTKAALTLQGLTTPGIFGTVDHFLQIQAPGLFVVVPNGSNALPQVFLSGDPTLKPVYKFADDPSKRIVLYNGVAPDSPAARSAIGAALGPLREILNEVLLAGFAKENIKRQLSQGQVLETGLARPGIDEFTGDGVQQQQSCTGSESAAAGGAIACQ